MYDKVNNKVSVIMPAFNAEKLIVESIKSVLKQTYKNFELIIVNDKSSDATLAIITEFANIDSRIVIINNIENQGVAESRNNAVDLATGRFIAFLDSDDLWMENKLEIQLKAMLERSASFSFGGYEIIDFDSVKMNKVVTPPQILTYEDLLKGSQIGCLTVMYDSNQIIWPRMKKIGHEDYLAWLDILSQVNHGIGIQETIGMYRVMQNSLSGNKKKAALWQYKIYREQLNFGLTKSIYYFCHYVLNALTKEKNVRG